MDGVALAAVIAGGVTGTAGIVATLWSNLKRLAFERAEGPVARRHERLRDQDERIYRGRQDVYPVLARWALKSTLEVESTHPLLALQGGRQPENALTDDDFRWREDALLKLQSKLDVFGSGEVAGLSEDLFRQGRSFFYAARVFEQVRGQRGTKEQDARQEMEAARQKVTDTYTRLRDRVRAEMTTPTLLEEETADGHHGLS